MEGMADMLREAFALRRRAGHDLGLDHLGPSGPWRWSMEGLLVGLEWRLPMQRRCWPRGWSNSRPISNAGRPRFDLPLDWGTGLNAAVRRAMADIPQGET